MLEALARRGIEIKVEGLFGDTASDVAVEVPTTPGDEEDTDDTTDDDEDEQKPSEDEEPDSDSSGEDSKKPTLSGEYLTKTAQIDKAGTVPNIEVVMNVPNGIEKVEVKATTSDTELSGILSGMGFMNTFDTLRKHKASFVIEELGKPVKNNFTKVLKFKFDGKNEFKISSYRKEEIKNTDKDNSIVVEKLSL